jgi:hypothetical protein
MATFLWNSVRRESLISSKGSIMHPHESPSDAVLLGIIPILAFYPLSHVEWPE